MLALSHSNARFAISEERASCLTAVWLDCGQAPGGVKRCYPIIKYRRRSFYCVVNPMQVGNRCRNRCALIAEVFWDLPALPMKRQSLVYQK